MSLRIGIDIGSTTVKVVLLDEQNKLLFRSYERHYSKARERAAETLRSLADRLAGRQVRIVITGSAGLGVAKAAEIDFVRRCTPPPPPSTSTYPTPTRSSNWAARTPKSSFSAARWRSG